MAKRKQKFYVVWVGAKPGVYDTWPAANAQVAGFPGARYKSFTSRQAAQVAFGQGAPSTTNSASPTTKANRDKRTSRSSIQLPSLSVDAACSGNPGKMEYQGVSTKTREQIFHQAFPLGTNNIGEFLALVHGLAWCKAQDLSTLPIYTDSKIAMGWIAKKKCKTTLQHTTRTADLLATIARAEAWLHEHAITNPILKWDTKSWGEIPADFGRK